MTDLGNLVEETQQILGKIIQKPALEDELLKKPSFQFLHAIISEVQRNSGFPGPDVLTDFDMEPENVEDEESRVVYLTKVVTAVADVVGPLEVNPLKIMNGVEVENTLILLQSLAKAAAAESNSNATEKSSVDDVPDEYSDSEFIFDGVAEDKLEEEEEEKEEHDLSVPQSGGENVYEEEMRQLEEALRISRKTFVDDDPELAEALRISSLGQDGPASRVLIPTPAWTNRAQQAAETHGARAPPADLAVTGRTRHPSPGARKLRLASIVAGAREVEAHDTAKGPFTFAPDQSGGFTFVHTAAASAPAFGHSGSGSVSGGGSTSASAFGGGMGASAPGAPAASGSGTAFGGNSGFGSANRSFSSVGTEQARQELVGISTFPDSVPAFGAPAASGSGSTFGGGSGFGSASASDAEEEAPNAEGGDNGSHCQSERIGGDVEVEKPFSPLSDSYSIAAAAIPDDILEGVRITSSPESFRTHEHLPHASGRQLEADEAHDIHEVIKNLLLNVRAGYPPDESFNKTNVVVMGLTGAGKSTFINSLAGCELEPVGKDEARRLRIRPNALRVRSRGRGGAQDPVVTIGFSARKSETRVLQHISIPGQEFVIWDTPGFEDSGGPEMSIANAVNLKRLLRASQAKGLVVVVLLDATALDSGRGYLVKKTIETLFNLFGSDKTILSEHTKSMLFVVNKVSSDEDIPHDVLREEIANMAREEADLHIDMHTQIFLFDPLQRHNNTSNAQHIIHAILSVKPIFVSKEIFTTSLSDRDRSLLTRIINVCKEWHSFIGEHLKDYTPEGRGKLRYYLKILKDACCLDAFLDCEHVQPLYNSVTTSIKSEESSFQRQENETLQIEEKELLEGRNQSFQSSLKEFCDTHHDALVQYCVYSGKNGWTLHSLVAFLRCEDPSSDRPLYPPLSDEAKTNRSPLTSRLPKESFDSVSMISHYFAKIDRLMALRGPDVAFIYGDQHDLETLKKNSSQKFLELAMEVIQPAFISLLENQFLACMSALRAEIPEVVENHFDSLIQTPITFSMLMSSNPSQAYFPDSLMREFRQLLDMIRMYDSELHSEKFNAVNHVLLHMNSLAIEQKATEAANHVTEMLEEFRSSIMTSMVDSAADIETGGLDLVGALLKMFPQYPEAWSVFDNINQGTHRVIEMKKGLFEKQNLTFSALKEEAKNFKVIPALVTSCGRQDVFILRICIADSGVRDVKRQIAQKWHIPEDQQVLVCCGEVLEDDVELSQFQFHLERERLWVIWRNLWGVEVGLNHEVDAKISFVWAQSDDAEEVMRRAVALDNTMSEMDMKQWTSLFSIFCSLVEQHKFSKWAWNPSMPEKEALTSTKCALENMVGLSTFPQVRWYDEYGCALLVLNPVMDRLLLQIIAPDGWNFEIQGCRQYTSRPGMHDAKLLFVGSIEIHHLRVYLRRADMLLSRVERAREEKNRMHEKTPDMILAVLIEAISTIDLETKDLEGISIKDPRGGFTDVGRSVDGKARNNTWSLFQAVIHTLLIDSARPGLSASAMAHLHLWLTELMSAATSLAGATPEHVNRIMQMLASAVETFVLEDEDEAAAFEARCVAVRNEIQRVLQDRSQQACDSRMLHPERPLSLRKSDFNTTDLKFNIPQESVPNKDMTSIEERRKLALNNLSLLPAPLKPTSSFASALKWMDHDLLTPPTLGLTWCSIGETRPTEGRLLTNSELTNALQSQMKFTKEEWAAFGIQNLLATDFAQSGSSYFKPAGLTRGKRMALQIVMTSVENIFFTNAVTRMKEKKTLKQDEIQAMVPILERYRIVVSQYEITQAQMKVEILSRELLVVWAAFCLAHQAACSQHVLLQDFKVPLQASDLQHLVLSDRLAVDAAQGIASYLRTNLGRRNTIFSTRPGDETFIFASQFAEQSCEMTKIWEEDNKASTKRQEERWQVVKKKQARIKQLKTELQKLESEELQLRVDITKPSMYKRVKNFVTMVSASNLESQLSAVQGKISNTTKDIAQEDVPPPSILQPLPKTRTTAMAIIFFLQMPEIFQVLSHLSFVAQQMLLPPGNSVQLASVEGNGQNIELSVKQIDPLTMWSQYYVKYDGSCSPRDTTVILASSSQAPEGMRIGSASVMTYTSSSDGVWYPDEINPGLWWRGGNFELDRRNHYFSPFSAVNYRARVHYFTEALPAQAKSMQWSMPMYHFGDLGGAALEFCYNETRGNVAVAAQHAMPKWLSKSEYVCFGAVRSYPNQQDRKICVALRDRSLPLQELAVRKLIQQSLYQLGELSAGQDPTFIWKTDRQQGNFWSTFGDLLKDIADDLRPTRRNHLKMPVVANMAAYAGQWDATCRSIAMECSSIAKQWAQDELDDISGLVPETPEDSTKSALQMAKCCIFFMYAILCHSGSAKLSSDDARQLCALSILTENSRIFGTETKHDAAVQELMGVTQEILAARMNELIDYIEKDPEILSAAVREVLTKIPQNLAWKNSAVKGFASTCFEAISADNELYSVNLLSGSLLVNGLPLARLPNSILDHPLFQRSFPNRNFQVQKSANNVLETRMPIHGCIYKFFFSPSGDLVIQEVRCIESRESDEVFELLDGTPDRIEIWGNNLPSRLRALHSHWYCRSKRFIVLRPIVFDRRSAQFLIHDPTGTNEWTCFQLPEDEISHVLSSAQLLRDCQSKDRFVQISKISPPLKMMSDFETTKFIHFLLPADSDESLIVELPRYDLSFKLDDSGKLQSRNYVGWHLASCQSLRDELLGFEKYLILQQDFDDNTFQYKVILPAGTVVKVTNEPAGDSIVTIQISSECDAVLQHHAYNIHPRLKSIEATGVEARLQLAALYTATASLVPERGSLLTGAEKAAELIRQSWINRPLELNECNHLSSIARFAENAPSIRLLCEETFRSANQLYFLYKAAPPKMAYVSGLTDAVTHYRHEKQHDRLNARLLLTPLEEEICVGVKCAKKIAGQCLPIPRCLNLLPLPSSEHVTTTVQHYFEQLRMEEAVSQKEFPFKESRVTDTHMGKEILKELSESWNSYNLRKEVVLVGSLPRAIESLMTCYNLVQDERKKLEFALLRNMRFIPVSTTADCVSCESKELVTSAEKHADAALEQAPSGLEADKRKLAEMQADVCDLETNVVAPIADFGRVGAELQKSVRSSAMGASTGAPLSSWQVIPFRLKRAINRIPIPTIRDLARIAWEPRHLENFNCFLSETAASEFHAGVLRWLEFCVLEDKLRRMLSAARSDPQALQRELQDTKRGWSVREHPEWLIFEMEQQLQIREVQYQVAKHLMSNPGAIAQLSMGEGKTRVILPMLILHLGRAGNRQVLRLHILSALLPEASNYFHRHLTASILRKRIYLVPFDRDVHLDWTQAQVLRQSMTRCMLEGGAICIAPESRLSLELKWHEINLFSSGVSRNQEQQTGSLVMEELALLRDLDYCDILDESDEILRHKFQLMYACGSCEELPSGKQRWEMVQTLLHNLSSDAAIALTLKQPGVSTIASNGSGSAKPGSFIGIRMIPGKALDSCRADLIEQLAKSVLNENLSLFLKTIDEDKRKKLLRFVTDASMSLQEFAEEVRIEADARLDYILALRGLLAYGVLEYCMTRRHRVDFGINRSKSAQRSSVNVARVAVPFRACDTPAERAQYAHPDTLLVFTHLAYYEDGLSLEQLKDALSKLLKMSDLQQDKEYKTWLQLSMPHMKKMISRKERGMVDSVKKIDLTNMRLLDTMFRCFRHNMKTIDFWLSHLVLPVETKQFSSRLATNSWHLADNARNLVIGFSGTNDNKLLLPLQVAQSTPDITQLKATNAKMMDLFMSKSTVTCLQVQCDLADAVLCAAVRASGCAALIDAGALMAGFKNHEVAAKIGKLLTQECSKLQGVVFFDDLKSAWMFYSLKGHKLLLERSPVPEKDTFVYFDESRCRGADLKLASDAIATLTIGPDMCKVHAREMCDGLMHVSCLMLCDYSDCSTQDKLMQAAFRMRQLYAGQSLNVVLPPEIISKVTSITLCRMEDLQPKNVVDWVLLNTVESITNGISEWASQGSYFCTTKNKPNLRLIDEKLKLTDLYAASFTESTALKAVEKSQAWFRQRNQHKYPMLKHTMELILQRAELFGSDILIKASGLDEACEREIENERETQQETESESQRQLMRMLPASETVWGYESIFSASSPRELPPDAGVMSLKDAVCSRVLLLLGCIEWDNSIYVTRNFLHTVEKPTGVGGILTSDLGHYLRPVDAAILFGRDSTLLLLSEGEADVILRRYWDIQLLSKEGSVHENVFINVSFLNGGLQLPQMLKTKAINPERKHKAQNLPALSANGRASLKLFCGGTMFCEDEQKALRETLLSTPQAKQVAHQFTIFRDSEHLVQGSDLEAITENNRLENSDLYSKGEAATAGDKTGLISTGGVPPAAANDSAAIKAKSVVGLSGVTKEILATTMQLIEGAGDVHKFEILKLILGNPADSDLREFLGLEDNGIFGKGMLDMVSAMKDEWREHGSEDDWANFIYVEQGRACDPKWIPTHVKASFSSGAMSEADFDTGHSGMYLQDFLNLTSSKLAGLKIEHILALRLYSSSSYRLFNNFMRSRTRPHPIKFTVWALNEALKKLKKVEAKLKPDEYNKVKRLYRGMKNMTLDFEELERQGGTELAFMSTSMSYDVAKSFATTLGLKWVEIGSEKPQTENEIINEALATALKSQKEFTKKEFEDFQVYGLTESSYIRVVDCYFKPDTRRGHALIFEYVAQGNSKGVAIEEFSIFPWEKEYLYTALTYLIFDPQGVSKQEDGTVLVRVTPQMS